VDHSLPSPCDPCAIERGRRRGKELLRLLISRLEPRDSHRRRDAAHLACLDPLHRHEQPADRVEDAGRGRLREEDRELVATDPAGEVVEAGAFGDRLADRGEHRVAGPVAVLEVDVAKAIDVEQGDGHRPLVTARALEVELELGAKGAQRQQSPRDGVVGGGELGCQIFSLARGKHWCWYRPQTLRA